MRLYTTEHFSAVKVRKAILFFLCPHGVSIKKLKLCIHHLCKQGYDVYAYEFTKAALDSGDPTILPALIKEVRQSVEEVIKGISEPTEIGMFGSSLGSFITYNILDIPGLQWAVMSTGGNMAHAVWAMDDTRTSFQTNGVSYKTLDKLWHGIQNPIWKFTNPPKVLLVSATRDEVATLEHARIGHEYMSAHGVDSHFVVQKGLNHKYALFYNFAFINRLIKQLHSIPSAH